MFLLSYMTLYRNTCETLGELKKTSKHSSVSLRLPTAFLILPINLKIPIIVKLRSRRLGGFLLCLRFIFFFRFVSNYIQTSADDVPLGQLSSPDDVINSQLWAIS